MMTFSEVIVSSSEKKYIFYISSISIAVNNWHMCPDEGKLGAICFLRPRRWNNFVRDVTREIFSSRAHTLTQEQNMIHAHEKRYYVELVLNRRNNNIRRKMTQQVSKILFLQSKLSGLKAPGFILLNWFFTRRLWQHHNWTSPEGDISKKIPTSCFVNSSPTLSDAEVWTLSRKKTTFLLILQNSGSR